jgi:hypothetical protein
VIHADDAGPHLLELYTYRSMQEIGHIASNKIVERRVHLSKALSQLAPFDIPALRLDAVVGGIPILRLVIFRLLRAISDPRNRLHILQTKFYWHQKTKWGSMFQREGLPIVVCDKQRLRMVCRCQVDRDKVGVGISRVIEVHRRFHAGPSRLRYRG